MVGAQQPRLVGSAPIGPDYGYREEGQHPMQRIRPIGHGVCVALKSSRPAKRAAAVAIGASLPLAIGSFDAYLWCMSRLCRRIGAKFRLAAVVDAESLSGTVS